MKNKPIKLVVSLCCNARVWRINGDKVCSLCESRCRTHTFNLDDIYGSTLGSFSRFAKSLFKAGHKDHASSISLKVVAMEKMMLEKEQLERDNKTLRTELAQALRK